MTIYPYDFMFYDEKTLFKKLFKPGKPIRHHETCPVCGRTLVNIYRRDGIWKCKKCWDKEDLQMSIGNKIMKLQVGDKIRINDWEQPFTVCGVSENYVLAYCGHEYTIIAKRPTDYQYNGIMPGAYVCSPDNLIFGYIGGYHFDDPKWVEQYLGDLESGEIEMSRRNRAEIYTLDMEDDHGSTDI